MTVRGVSTVRQTTPPPQAAGYVGPPRQPVFSRPGFVVDSIGEESPPFVFILSGHLVRLVAALRVVDDADIDISINLNGVSFTVLVIPAGQNTAQLSIDQPFGIADFLTVSVTAAGTLGQDLTIIGDPRQ